MGTEGLRTRFLTLFLVQIFAVNSESAMDFFELDNPIEAEYVDVGARLLLGGRGADLACYVLDV